MVWLRPLGFQPTISAWPALMAVIQWNPTEISQKMLWKFSALLLKNSNKKQEIWIVL
jgi:hypothetical protein